MYYYTCVVLVDKARGRTHRFRHCRKLQSQKYNQEDDVAQWRPHCLCTNCALRLVSHHYRGYVIISNK